MHELDLFDAEELLVLARIDLEKGAVDRALAKFKQALSTGAAQPALKLEAARVYAELGLRNKAIPLFQAYVAAAPEDVDAQFQLGMAMFEEGMTEAALDLWGGVLTASPGYPPALYFRAAAQLRMGRPQDAAKLLRSAMDSIQSDNLYFARSRDLLAMLEADKDAAGTDAMRLIGGAAYKTQH